MILKLSLQPRFAGIQTINGSAYSGVTIDATSGAGIVVTDNSVSLAASQNTTPVPGGGVLVNPAPGQVVKPVNYQDLVGQPTWIEVNKIQFTCPMRSDIYINDLVKLPQSLAATAIIPRASAGQPFGAARDKTTFEGNFQITSARHVGNFRSTDKDAWVTIFEAILTGANTVFIPKLAPGVNRVVPYGYPR
jgi:hypothetical protein